CRRSRESHCRGIPERTDRKPWRRTHPRFQRDESEWRFAFGIIESAGSSCGPQRPRRRWRLFARRYGASYRVARSSGSSAANPSGTLKSFDTPCEPRGCLCDADGPASERKLDHAMKNSPIVQLTLARLREFFREPEAVFWVYGFPILMAVLL